MAEPLASLLRQPFRSVPGDVREQLLQGKRLIHVPDIAALEDRNPEGQAALDAGVRTLLILPLRKGDALLGYITAKPSRSPPIHRQADCLAGKLRCAGSDRDGERAAAD